MTNQNIRYDRQERIKNWKQEKLTDARVAIIGTGHLAQFTSASLAALGIGNIKIYDDGKSYEKGFLIGSEREDRAQKLERKLHEMNPAIQVKGEKLRGDNLADSLGKEYDVVLDLTNSPELKERVLAYALTHGKAVVSASSGKTGGEIHIVNQREDYSRARVAQYAKQQQGAFPSEILGGMISEEVRKLLMPLIEGEKAVRKLVYNATAERRFNAEGDFEAQPYEDLSQKRVLIVGAGALGNFVALGAALEGIGKIDILDFDEVEAHNLNRQIMFYDAVGRKKSEALAEKIKEIAPRAEIRGLVGKLDEKTTYFAENEPDLILDCVDSFATRAITNYFAVRHGIPLVSGGTNSQSGQVVVYEPGMSACLDCKLGVEQALGIALQGNKCTNTPDPSVIMTNEIVGGMMVGEALKVLDRGYGSPVDRILKYDSTVSARGGLVSSSDPCECEKGEIGEWMQGVKDRFSLIGGKK